MTVKNGNGAMPVKVTRRKLSDYIPDPRNPNKGSIRGVAALEKSVDKFGAGRSGLVDKDGIIRAGNHTAEQLYAAGIEDVIEVETNGKEWVVVRRVDMDEKTGKAYAVADNRIGEFIEWDGDTLAALASEGVDLSALWNDDELAALIGAANEPKGDPGAAIDRAEQLRTEYGVERGQIWSAGRHRLMCGDAYDAAMVAALLDGRAPDMLHIDPPYGISIVKPGVNATSGEKLLPPGFSRRQGAVTGNVTDAAFRSVGATGRIDRTRAAFVGARDRRETEPVSRPATDGATWLDGKPRGAVRRPSRTAIVIQSNTYPVIEGDDRPFDPARFVDGAPIVIMWGANYYADKLPSRACWIVWDKRENITRNDFADCELAWTNQDKPSRIFYHLWNGLHKGSQHGERRTHPTEKPVALFAEIGKMYADGKLWLDLFSGTGAQIVAAEQTSATCYAMEWEPLYVAVTLDRLQKMGLEPKRT